jgi:hypothetical protein
MKKGVLYEVSADMILQPNASYFVSCKETEDEVGLVITETELQLPYITEEEAGQWLGIIIQGEYPVKFLLGAAIALHISRLCETKILDERCFWSKNRENDLEAFLDSIRLNITNDSSCTNIQTVSEDFYKSLPKGM